MKVSGCVDVPVFAWTAHRFPQGPRLLLYRGVGSVLTGAFQVVSMQGTVSQLEAGQLAGTSIQDLIVARSHHLEILRRGVSGSQTQILALPERIASFATGNFIEGAQRELAVLLDNGDLHWIAAESDASSVQSGWSNLTAPYRLAASDEPNVEEGVWRISPAIQRGLKAAAITLSASRISASLTDELVLLVRNPSSLRFLENESTSTTTQPSYRTWLPRSLSNMALESTPIKIAAGRFNADAIQDLVVLTESGDLKYTVSGCVTTFTVDSLLGGGDQSVIDFVFDGVCDGDPDAEKGACTLEAALEEAEGAPAPVCVQFSKAGTINASGVDIPPSVFVDGSSAPGFAGVSR